MADRTRRRFLRECREGALWLLLELGIRPCRRHGAGRPRALGPAIRERIYAQMIHTPRNERNVTYRTLARMYRVSPQTIQRIALRGV